MLSVFQGHSWKHKTSLCSLRVWKVGGIRDSLGLNVSFWVCSKPEEKHTRNKNPWLATRVLPVWADAVRKAKAQLKLKLARGQKHKKGFFRYINNKQKEILAHCSAAEVSWSPIMLKRLRFPTRSSPLFSPWEQVLG